MNILNKNVTRLYKNIKKNELQWKFKIFYFYTIICKIFKLKFYIRCFILLYKLTFS